MRRLPKSWPTCRDCSSRIAGLREFEQIRNDRLRVGPVGQARRPDRPAALDMMAGLSLRSPAIMSNAAGRSGRRACPTGPTRNLSLRICSNSRSPAMRLEQSLHVGQDFGSLLMIAAGAGYLDSVQPPLHPLRLSGVELRPVRCEYTHLAG